MRISSNNKPNLYLGSKKKTINETVEKPISKQVEKLPKSVSALKIKLALPLCFLAGAAFDFYVLQPKKSDVDTALQRQLVETFKIPDTQQETLPVVETTEIRTPNVCLKITPHKKTQKNAEQTENLFNLPEIQENAEQTENLFNLPETPLVENTMQSEKIDDFVQTNDSKSSQDKLTQPQEELTQPPLTQLSLKPTKEIEQSQQTTSKIQVSNNGFQTLPPAAQPPMQSSGVTSEARVVQPPMQSSGVTSETRVVQSIPVQLGSNNVSLNKVILDACEGEINKRIDFIYDFYNNNDIVSNNVKKMAEMFRKKAKADIALLDFVSNNLQSLNNSYVASLPFNNKTLRLCRNQNLIIVQESDGYNTTSKMEISLFPKEGCAYIDRATIFGPRGNVESSYNFILNRENRVKPKYIRVSDVDMKLPTKDGKTVKLYFQRDIGESPENLLDIVLGGLERESFSCLSFFNTNGELIEAASSIKSTTGSETLKIQDELHGDLTIISPNGERQNVKDTVLRTKTYEDGKFQSVQYDRKGESIFWGDNLVVKTIKNESGDTIKTITCDKDGSVKTETKMGPFPSSVQYFEPLPMTDGKFYYNENDLLNFNFWDTITSPQRRISFPKMGGMYF